MIKIKICLVSFQRSSHLVGTIDPQCEITPVVVQAYESARFLCEQYYLSAPAMDYTSYDGSTRCYLLLNYILIKIIKYFEIPILIAG